MGYVYFDYGNKEVLGKVHALYGFMNIPLVMSEKNDWLFNYRISFGMSYLTRKFDVHENDVRRERCYFFKSLISSFGFCHLHMGKPR